jgi:methionyl-tRNA synthetase
MPVIKFCQAKMNATVPDYTKYSDSILDSHKAEVNNALKEYIAYMEATKLRAGLAHVMHIS